MIGKRTSDAGCGLPWFSSVGIFVLCVCLRLDSGMGRASSIIKAVIFLELQTIHSQPLQSVGRLLSIQ